MSTNEKRARLALVVADQEAADYAYGLVGDAATPMPPGELIRAHRRLRLRTLTGLDRAVIVEYLSGTTWEQIAAALGLSLEEAQARYQETCEMWAAERRADDTADFGDFTIGLHGDDDLEGTAAALDSWYKRHAAPWGTPEEGPGPVTRALT